MKENGDGISFSFNNKRILVDRTGIGYDKLVTIFTRKKRL